MFLDGRFIMIRKEIFIHNFTDAVNSMCPANDGIEYTEHFFVVCPSFDIQRQDLLAGVSKFLRPFVQIETLPNNVLAQYLLNGNEELPNDVNRTILEHTLNIIHSLMLIQSISDYRYYNQKPRPNSICTVC